MLKRYLVAIAFVAMAVAVTAAPPQLGHERPFLLLNGAVILAAWYGGRGPAAVALALSVLTAHYLLLPAHRSASPSEGGGVLQLGLFILEAFGTGALTVSISEARAKAEALVLRSQRNEEQLRRLNQAHRALSLGGQALVHAEDQHVLLEGICRAIVEVAGYRMCWVGRAEHDPAKTVRPIAQAGCDDGYVQAADVTWANVDRGRGPAGTAIRTRRPFVVQDFATHPAVAPWRAQALARGYGSVIGLPLMVDGDPFGALTIYASKKEAFDAEAVHLLADLANDLSYGITALRTRAAVAVERARFERVIMLAPVAIVVLSGPKHLVRLVNPRWTRLGIATEAPIGRPLSAVVPEAASQGFLARLDEMYATGEPQDATEARLDRQRQDGSVVTRYFNLAGEPLRGPDGAVTDIVIALAEVTGQVEARTVAEQASRAKDEFLRIASHELRTPLTPILCWAQALKRGGWKDPAKLERGIDLILTSARAMARIVDDLIDLSGFVAGAMHMEMHPMALGAVVRGCVAEVEPIAIAKGVGIELSLAPDTHMVGDAGRLEQVVKHLLSNSIKFSSPGSRVHVEASRQGGGLTLRVRDSGKGIPPDELPHVFELFRTGDASEKRTEGGLGLGLALVRYIVEAHGGAIRAESPGPGCGATFVVEFPADRPTPIVDR